jgi:hypothetical protein
MFRRRLVHGGYIRMLGWVVTPMDFLDDTELNIGRWSIRTAGSVFAHVDGQEPVRAFGVRHPDLRLRVACLPVWQRCATRETLLSLARSLHRGHLVIRSRHLTTDRRLARRAPPERLSSTPAVSIPVFTACGEPKSPMWAPNSSRPGAASPRSAQRSDCMSIRRVPRKKMERNSPAWTVRWPSTDRCWPSPCLSVAGNGSTSTPASFCGKQSS